jgi:group I intron endonuclease
MKAIIYQLTSKTGKMYVGSTTTDLQQRMRCHYYYLRKGTHPNFILQAAFDKYGKFKESILEEFEYIELSEVINREQTWLDKLKPKYNLCKKAYVQHMTPEMKVKISKALKGKSHSVKRIKAIKEGIKKARLLNKAWGVKSQSAKDAAAKLARERFSKPVVMFSIEGYTVFNSKKDAVKSLKINETMIRRSIQTGLPSAKTGLWFVQL